ncbi:MAG: M14 family zinc carboxypeptidase, partial [Bryobacteraceae bacterium]
MGKRLFLVACAAALSWGAVPTPREHFGFTLGDPGKLADYSQIVSYFQSLEKSSNRIKLMEFGQTSEGRPMYVAFLSSPENLKKLEHYRDINRRLALGLADESEAHKLAEQGKIFVWIDSGLHASEVAPSQHAPELAYRMLTDESEETRRIRQNAILIEEPAINPDGLEMVVQWYRKNLGTLYENAPLPRLYQKYSGHDNNRDWFMLNLAETRNVTRLLFAEWFPEIVYNQHQSPPFPARIFVPPYAEPLNPNIPAAVMEGINMIGSAMKERFALAQQPGVLSYWGFDAWWDGGLRSVPAFHNMHGILTETAGYAYPAPKTYLPSDFPDHFGNGIPTKQPTVFYERPWMGGTWGVRNAIDYMLTADFAILDLASARAAHFLYKSWEMAHENIAAGERGTPFAYLVPPDQWDPSSARGMLRRFAMAGIEVRRASAPFQAGGKEYPEGTYVLNAAQPFRGYLMDLLEPQHYPELRAGSGGVTKRPYDIAGWTLSMSMGVQVDRVDRPFQVKLEDEADLAPLAPSRDHRDDSFFLTLADLLKRGVKTRWANDGRLLEEGDPDFGKGAWELHTPRVGVYESWIPNSDAGWTEWLLDTFQAPHAMLHNDDFHSGDLRARADTIILPAQSAASILYGIRPGERPGNRPGMETGIQRPEYTGGIELAGLQRLDQFVRDGGTLIAFDPAAALPVEHFPLPLRLLIHPPLETPERFDNPAPESGYYCPGSLLRITVDTSNPLAFGMPKEAFAFSSGGQAFEVALLPEFNKGDEEIR